MTVTAPSTDPTTNLYVKAPVVRLEALREWLEERQWASGEDGLHVCLDALLKELRQQDAERLSGKGQP